MTSKERMLATLRFEEPDRIPHFETVFQMTQEPFGEGFLSPDILLLMHAERVPDVQRRAGHQAGAARRSRDLINNTKWENAR